ncbi:MAG: hypothetical protein GC185_02355 [Alphaproteobacteria bacterium]|nr:hypothetical protein [Alphaproteobacteria bacterium]
MHRHILSVISVLVLICAFLFAPPSFAQQPDAQDRKLAAQEVAVSAEMTDAINKAAAIINQPVAPVAYDPSFHVGYYSPGWFHKGAIKPNFDAVDVRKTQELPYAKFDYVRSDLNPDIMFPGAQLEFNRMTKYFYADRSVPKKRLTQKEMIEINALYRIIGKDEKRLTDIKKERVEGPAVGSIDGGPLKSPVAIICLIGAVLVAGYFLARGKKNA